MRGRAGEERGAALPFVILLIVALFAVAHGGLVASLAERAGSRAAMRDLLLRGAADHALGAAMGSAPGPWMDSLGVWERRTTSLGPVGLGATEGTVRRLAVESWLVGGAARTPTGVTARSVQLAWSLDPLARVAALGGVVTVGYGGTVVVAGTADASQPTAVVPPMQAGDCDPWLATLDVRYAAAPLSAFATLPDTTTSPRLGLLDFDRLLATAPVTVAGSGTPAPAEALGQCLAAVPWVWGDPDRPWRPCGAFLALRGAGGDLVVDGGVGQGLLVVDGDLTLRAGARFYGLAVTTGVLRLEGGSTLEGMALAGAGVAVGSASTLRGSACWAVRALAANRDALGVFVPVPSGRLGPV